MSNQADRLSTQTIALHWLLAIAMIGMLVFGLILEDMPRGDANSDLMWWHKGIGVAILAFALWRLSWRLIEGFPVALSKSPLWQERAAYFVHWFLLLGTLFMPISGIMISLGRDSYHVEAVIDKDGTLSRMTGRRATDAAKI